MAHSVRKETTMQRQMKNLIHMFSLALGAVGLPGAVDGYQVNFRLPADTLKGLASLQVSAGMVADTSVKVMVK